MQIVLFLIFILLIIIVFAIKKDELSMRSKILMLVSIIAIITLASLYEFTKESNSLENREKLNIFLQGKTLFCDGIEVNQKSFQYISGTQVFMPNKTNETYRGVVLELSKCTAEKK